MSRRIYEEEVLSCSRWPGLRCCCWPIPGRAAIKGDYIEARSADVYTGPCFANGEVGLVGNEAILAWKITRGDWKGTSLNGLGVVAVVKAHATLGDPYHSSLPGRICADR